MIVTLDKDRETAWQEGYIPYVIMHGLCGQSVVCGMRVWVFIPLWSYFLSHLPDLCVLFEFQRPGLCFIYLVWFFFFFVINVLQMGPFLSKTFPLYNKSWVPFCSVYSCGLSDICYSLLVGTEWDSNYGMSTIKRPASRGKWYLLQQILNISCLTFAVTDTTTRLLRCQIPQTTKAQSRKYQIKFYYARVQPGKCLPRGRLTSL